MSSADSAFYRFLSINKCWVTKRDVGRTLTHTLLNGFNGGKVDSSGVNMSEFYSAYQQDLNNKLCLYVNELKSGVFPMFFDLDVEHTTDTASDDYDVILRIVYTAVTRFFVGTDNISDGFNSLLTIEAI